MTLCGNGKTLQGKIPHRNHIKQTFLSDAKDTVEKLTSTPTDERIAANVVTNKPCLLNKIQPIPPSTLSSQAPIREWMRPPTVIPTVKKPVTFTNGTTIGDQQISKTVKTIIPIVLPLSMNKKRHAINVLDKYTNSSTIKYLAKYGHLAKVHLQNGNFWNYSLFEDGDALEKFNVIPSYYSLVTETNASVTDRCLRWVKARRYDYAKSSSTCKSNASDVIPDFTTGVSHIDDDQVQSIQAPRKLVTPSLSATDDDDLCSSGESDSAIVDCTIDDGESDSKCDFLGSSNACQGPFKRCRYDYSLKGYPIYEAKPCYIPASIGKPTVPIAKGKTKVQTTRKATSVADSDDVNYKTLFARYVNSMFGSHPTRRDMKKDILVRTVPGISAKRIYGTAAQECEGIEIGEFCNAISAAVTGPPRRPRNAGGTKSKEGNDNSRSKWDPMHIRMCSQHRACRSNTTKLGHKPHNFYYGSLKLSDKEKKAKNNGDPLAPPLHGIFVVTGSEYPEAAIETFERSYKPEIELLLDRGKPVEPWEVQEWQSACGLTKEQLLTHKRATGRLDQINVGLFGERKDPCVDRPVAYPQHFHVLDSTKDILKVLENFNEKTVKPHTKRIMKRNALFGSHYNGSKGLSQWLMNIKDGEPGQQSQNQQMVQVVPKQQYPLEGPMFRLFSHPCENYLGDFLETTSQPAASQGLSYEIIDIGSVGLRSRTTKGALGDNNDMGDYWKLKFGLTAHNGICKNGYDCILEANEPLDFSDAQSKNIEDLQVFDAGHICESSVSLEQKDYTDPPISVLVGSPAADATETRGNLKKDVTGKIGVLGAQRSFALKVLLRFPYLDLRCLC